MLLKKQGLGKQLSRSQMKQLRGGYVKCEVKASCPGGGSISCAGVTGDGNNGGCDSVEGSQISAVSCRQQDGTYVFRSCTSGS
jgi:hypothetical protein